MAPERYVSQPVSVPPTEGVAPYSRIDLVFHGVDHSGSSYGARVFLGAPEADESTPLNEESGYVGSFFVFGHGGCFGDVGHCDVPEAPRGPHDRRLPHPLTRQKKTLVLPEPLKGRLLENAGGTVTVTVVPVASESPVVAEDELLKFDRLSLITYG
jgi:tyrosinase